MFKDMNFTHEYLYGRTNTKIHCEQRKSGEVYLGFILYLSSLWEIIDSDIGQP